MNYKFNVVRERTSSLPSAILGGRGERVDLVISELASGHTLLDVVIAHLMQVDLVTRAEPFPSMLHLRLRGRRSGTARGGRPRGDTSSKLTRHFCPRRMISYATVHGGHFLRAVHHPCLLVSL